MLSELKTGRRLVGVKQSVRAIECGDARCVFVAEDADTAVVRPVLKLCDKTDAQIIAVPTMRELGAACGIDVGAAVAVLLR